MRIIRAGATSQSIYIEVLDSTSTTGARKTGLAYNTSSLTAYYALNGAAAVQITLATQTAAGAYSSGGFVEVDATNMPGVYRLDVPNAAIASGPSVVITLKGATGMVPVSVEIQLVAWNPQDTVRGGLTALPNAAAEAAGGLYTRGTGAGQINQANNGQIDANAARTGGTTNTGRDIGASVLLSAGTGTGQLDFTSGVVKANLAQILGTALTETAGQIAAAFKQFFDVASPTGTMKAITLVSTTTTLTNAPSDSSGVTTLLSRLSSTRAGYLDNLSAGAVALASTFTGITSLAQWLGLLGGKQTGNSTALTELKATGAGSGTFDPTTDSQEAIRDNMGTAQTGDAYARLGAPAGASVSADVASIKTDTGTTIPGRLPAALVSGRMDASVGAYQTGLTPLQPTTAGRTLDVTATGEAGIDWANIGSPTTTVGLSGTTVKTATDVETDTADIQTRLPAALTANGNMKSSLLEIISTALSEGATGRLAAAWQKAWNVASSTWTSADINQTGDNYARIGAPAGASVSADIAAAKVDTAAILDDTGTSGVVVAAASKTGYRLSSTGVQDIWDALTSALTTVGSVGKLLVDNVNATISSRLASASYTAPLDAAGTRTAVGLASANLDTQIDALPTASENATALLDASNGIETGYTPRQVLRLISAVLLGKVSGGATTTNTFRDITDSKDRVTATVDADGNRTAVTKDAS